MLKNIKKGFTLIELIISMIVMTTLVFLIGNFTISFYSQTEELSKMQKEYKEVTLGLTSLQKIINEKARYLSFNYEILPGGLCEGKISSPASCNTKFYFYIDDGFGGEEKYKVVFDDCIGDTKKPGKILYYSNNIDVIPLTRCIESSDTFPNVTHEVTFINEDIKEKIIRYELNTEYSSYKTTLFTKD